MREVADRISCIESEVSLEYNEKVKSFIDYFTVRDRPYTQEVLNKTALFFPIFEETLAKYNLPDELKFLSIVESGLRPNAISRANAVGLWQFMSSTGKMYGLNNDWYLDDRMDPYASTDAAARHLRDLYSMFDDWELALAAYNCGPGNVRKAIRRSGYKKNFGRFIPISRERPGHMYHSLWPFVILSTMHRSTIFFQNRIRFSLASTPL